MSEITEFTDYLTNMGIKIKKKFPLSHSVCYFMHFMIAEIKLDLLYSFTDVSHASVVKAGVKRKLPSGIYYINLLISFLLYFAIQFGLWVHLPSKFGS